MSEKVILLMGVSGSGKTTILKELLLTYKNLFLVRSYVTRPIRMGERDGDRYTFISKEEFEAGIENNEFLEYAIVHEKAYYGTKIQDIQETLQKGLIPITEIDVRGLEKIQRSINIPWNYVSIFLNIPDDLIKLRLTGRGPISQEDIDTRLASANREREFAKQYCDYIVEVDADLKENIYRVNQVIDQILQE